MKLIQLIKSLFLLAIVVAIFTSCTKDSTDGNHLLSSISLQLKSTSTNYNKVYLDIEDVEVRVKANTNAVDAWVSLNAINVGTYNVCDYTNSEMLLLVDYFEIIPTHIYEIRLVLGNNNFFDLNNVLHSIDVTTLGNAYPSNNIQIDLVANRFYDVTIDFDVDGSLSFNEELNMMVLDPKIYTAIKQIRF